MPPKRNIKERIIAALDRGRGRHWQRRRRRYLRWLDVAKQWAPWLNYEGYGAAARAAEAMDLREFTGRFTPPLWGILGIGAGFYDSASVMADDQKIAWLASSKNWRQIDNFVFNPNNGPHWRGIRVLGIGSYGLVGVWESVGIKTPSGKPYRVVVKQSRQSDPSLREESDILRDLSQTGSKNIAQVKALYHEEIEQGTSDWDRGDTNVSRICLEFCENGDVSQFLKSMHRLYSIKKPVPEELVWRFFECLARSLCAMAEGREDEAGQKWATEIGHFDIKPQNSKQWRLHVEIYLMTFNYLKFSLEATKQTTTDLIFLRQVAKCIYELMSHGITFRNNRVHIVVGRDDSIPITTFGRKLINLPGYSESLKLLVFHCLALDPTQRPTPRQLLEDTTRALRFIVQLGPQLNDPHFRDLKRTPSEGTSGQWSISKNIITPTHKVRAQRPTNTATSASPTDNGPVPRKMRRRAAQPTAQQNAPTDYAVKFYQKVVHPDPDQKLDSDADQNPTFGATDRDDVDDDGDILMDMFAAPQLAPAPLGPRFFPNFDPTLPQNQM
ncbi:hypothetical protein G7Y89_g11018 [Cudoniella acicularis]|uniref:non-specific serine/threonine protein kinase n=1 Tax=Cudoniella acicularis TaxID=354080 RepID=A0A8H4W0F0_9HELO|nr:hypothetical protein G7Y89_g11018 [Cudoniella acicularis]